MGVFGNPLAQFRQSSIVKIRRSHEVMKEDFGEIFQKPHIKVRRHSILKLIVNIRTMKRVLITGITGQDGTYLAKFLLSKRYEVFGTYRRVSSPNFWRLQYLDIFDKITLIPADMVDHSSIQNAISISQPDEIYHLAAQSFVESSFQTPHSTGEITGIFDCIDFERTRPILSLTTWIPEQSQDPSIINGK